MKRVETKYISDKYPYLPYAFKVFITYFIGLLLVDTVAVLGFLPSLGWSWHLRDLWDDWCYDHFGTEFVGRGI